MDSKTGLPVTSSRSAIIFCDGTIVGGMRGAQEGLRRCVKRKGAKIDRIVISPIEQRAAETRERRMPVLDLSPTNAVAVW
jgi:hypothetical protein